MASQRMTRPRPLDFDLNEAIITEVESRIDQLEQKSLKINKWIPFLSTAVLYLGSSLMLFPRWNLLSFAYTFLPTLVTGLLLGKATAQKVTAYTIKKGLGNSRDYRNYLRYQKSLRRYQKWFWESRRRFWKNQKGLDFEFEICSLLKRAGLRVRQQELQDRVGYRIIVGADTMVYVEKENGRVSSERISQRFKELKKTGLNRAIIISKNGFTKEAIQSVKFKPIKLWDINHLVRLQKKVEN